MAKKDDEQELDTELETELDPEGEDEQVETPGEGDDSAAGGDESDTGAGGEEKVAPTVEDAIAEALKALEPKTAEEKAAEAATAAAAKKKAGDEKAGVKPEDEPKLDKDGKPIVDGKKVDHVNDPIPPQVSERTRERITSLVSTVKELTTTVENQSAIVAAIQETGATPEDFSAMITYMRYVHSDKPTDLENAYKMLQGGMRTIANKLGRSLPEADVLDGHQDLIDAVASGQTTAKIAEEVAIARNRGAATAATNQSMMTARQQEDAAEAERKAAITDLNDLGALLKQSDPNYQAKYDAIVPSLQAAFATMRPSQWKATFNKAYREAKVTARPVVTPPVAAPKKTVPLRPSAPAGGGKREAKTLEDAIFGEGFPE